jgi:ketosteroid isomerase-like protein
MHPSRRTACQSAAFALVVLASIFVPVPVAAQDTGPAMSRRSLDDLVAEIRVQHTDIVEAIRNANVPRAVRHLTPDAKLVLPNGDTIRGREAIGREIERLHGTYTIEAVRATAAARVIRCTDGLLERTGDWALQVVKPDQSREFLREAFGARWVYTPDSMRISLLTLRAPTGLSAEDAACIDTESVRLSQSRFRMFVTAGVLMPAGYVSSARHEYGTVGFGNVNIGTSTVFPEGKLPDAPAYLGFGTRLYRDFWVSVTTPRRSASYEIGRCNRIDSTHVNINRKHFPVGLSLDYQRGIFSIGAGPARSWDSWYYQELGLQTACGSGGTPDVLQRTSYDKQLTGMTGHIATTVPINAYTGFMLRAQFFRFPSEELPALKSGAVVSVRDLTTVLGLGMRVTF